MTANRFAATAPTPVPPWRPSAPAESAPAQRRPAPSSPAATEARMVLEDKVIISCALTGAVTTKKHCPAIPYTPIEIAEEAARAHAAGAAIAHVHARTDQGSPSWEVATFRRIKEEVKRRVPELILNWSTGGAGPMAERVKHVVEVPADVVALNMGSMNYARWKRDKKAFAF